MFVLFCSVLDLKNTTISRINPQITLIDAIVAILFLHFKEKYLECVSAELKHSKCDLLYHNKMFICRI